MERDTCLLPFRHNPQRTVYFHDIVSREVLDVYERYARPASEQEQVPCQREVWIFQFDCAQCLKFLLRQKAALLMVGVNVVHCKRVSWYLSVVVSRGDDMFQWYGVYPHGRLRKPCLVAQVQAIVADEVLRKFVHRYVGTFILLSDKLGYILADSQVFQICALGAVFTHTFGKSRVLFVKGT